MSETPEIMRPPGRPAFTLPRIALGCGNFGGVGSAPEFFGKGLSEDQALAVMDAAWEAGITHFDTADAYGGGRSEASIGRWIATRGLRPGLTKYRRGEAFPAGSRMTQRPEPYRGLVTGATYDALGRLGEVAAGLRMSMAGLALAWLLADKRVTQVVIGPGRPDHLAPVQEALRHPLTATDVADLERAVA
jgi:aryl-alcohol dehydrogenase-like predicted oxidoreductase